MRTIRLNGELGKKFGRIHKLDVRSPGEAIRALCANFPDFKQELLSSADRGVGYRCIVDREALNPDHIAYPMSKSFSITPVVQGAGKVGSIILGAVLIVGAIALAPATGGGSLAALGQGIGFAGITYGNIALLGAALVLGGVAQLMTPTPQTSDNGGQTNENRYFDGPVNTTAQGATVPLGYGRCVVGSAVISASVTVEQQPNPTVASDLFINGLFGGTLYA